MSKHLYLIKANFCLFLMGLFLLFTLIFFLTLLPVSLALFLPLIRHPSSLVRRPFNALKNRERNEVMKRHLYPNAEKKGGSNQKSNKCLHLKKNKNTGSNQRKSWISFCTSCLLPSSIVILACNKHSWCLLSFFYFLVLKPF